MPLLQESEADHGKPRRSLSNCSLQHHCLHFATRLPCLARIRGDGILQSPDPSLAPPIEEAEGAAFTISLRTLRTLEAKWHRLNIFHVWVPYLCTNDKAITQACQTLMAYKYKPNFKPINSNSNIITPIIFINTTIIFINTTIIFMTLMLMVMDHW